jgi:hypothetical protein
VASLAALAVLWSTACEPEPPPLSMMVNTTTDGADVNPGDGICEMTAGGGDCSVRAAFEEAAGTWTTTTPNKRAVITVPEGSYQQHGLLEVVAG